MIFGINFTGTFRKNIWTHVNNQENCNERAHKDAKEPNRLGSFRPRCWNIGEPMNCRRLQELLKDVHHLTPQLQIYTKALFVTHQHVWVHRKSLATSKVIGKLLITLSCYRCFCLYQTIMRNCKHTLSQQQNPFHLKALKIKQLE